MNKAVRLFGKDLGILIGPRDNVHFSQILIYQPVNSKVPDKEMHVDEIVCCLPPLDSNKHINILHSFLNRIEIDGGIPIWRNSEFFGMKSFNKYSYDEIYFGRGELMIYFRNNFSEGYDIADYFVKKDIGLRFV